MFDISANQIITLTRGDTAATILYINLGTELQPLIYDLDKGDKVYFGICEPNYPFECAIVKKVFTWEDFDYENHCLKISFWPNDTEHLLPGLYYYQVKLYRESTDNQGNILEYIDTIVQKTKFYIVE